MRETLFEPLRPGYFRLKPPLTEVKAAILDHPDFAAFSTRVGERFAQWCETTDPQLAGFDQDGQPKQLIWEMSESLLAAFKTAPLLDPYAIYQQLMDYWAETMQDDAYGIAAEGWVAKPHRVLEEIKTGKKKGQMKDKGWACDLIPKPYLVARYFATEQAKLDALQADLEAAEASQTELVEEQDPDEGAFAELDKINKGEVTARLKEIKGDPEYADDRAILKQWLTLEQRKSRLKTEIKEADAQLDQLAHDHYAKLSFDEIKTLVIEDKWFARLQADVRNEVDRVSQTLTGRIRELSERYFTPLPALVDEVETLAARVDGHLERMGFPL